MLILSNMGEHESLEFRIGQLTGQVSAMTSAFNQLSTDFGKMSERMRNNEADTTKLTVKMSLLGMAAGGVGSLAITLISKLIERAF
jgi:hypothetical protein